MQKYKALIEADNDDRVLKIRFNRYKTKMYITWEDGRVTEYSYKYIRTLER